MTTELKSTINGVMLKRLKSFADDRGFFREIIRHSDEIFMPNAGQEKNTQNNFAQNNFAQWSHSKMGKNTVKAWHFHHRQTDWWYVPIGEVEAVLYDNRKESSTYQTKMSLLLGEVDDNDSSQEPYLLKIPPGVLHGLKVLSESAHLFYITSEIYDPKDEGRIPYNSSKIPHEWGEGVITVERDRVLHIPPYERINCE